MESDASQWPNVDELHISWNTIEGKWRDSGRIPEKCIYSNPVQWQLLIYCSWKKKKVLRFLNPILPENFKAFYQSKAMHHDYSYFVDRECRNEETWWSRVGRKDEFSYVSHEKYNQNYLTGIHSMTVERGHTNKTKNKHMTCGNTKKRNSFSYRNVKSALYMRKLKPILKTEHRSIHSQ